MSVSHDAPAKAARVERPRWWHDRPLVALLILFALVSPLVTQRIYASDEIQYFAYTRSLFFDGDFDFGNEYLYFYESDKVKFQAIYEDLYLKREPLTDLPLNVAPIGTGLLWMPPYALAHVFTIAANGLGADIPADGYSRPYIAAICLTSYVLGCAALLLSYSLARRFFGARTAALAVAAIWLATPLIFYTVIAPPWSHATSFFAVTLFIWYWARTRAENARKLYEWLALGGLAGMMMLVREQDALFMVVPLVEAGFALFARATTQGEHAPSLVSRSRAWIVGLIMMGIAAAITFIPQLIAYRAITGRFAPSNVVSGKFNWTAPNALNVLFSPEHGLLPWTPVLALCLVGLAIFWRRDRVMATAFAIALAFQVYIAGSFLTWQSAGSFGQRRFINSTAIFILGFAMLVTWLFARGVPRWALVAMGTLFVAWNGGLLIQYALWCSSQRQALDWATVLRGQVENFWRVPSLAWDYLFNRESFFRRTRC